MNEKNQKSLLHMTVSVLIGVTLFIIATLMKNSAPWIPSCLLVGGGVFEFFFIAYRVDKGNVISLRALFSGIWLATIGIANLKLLDFQPVWETKTWLILALTYVMFNLGITVGHMCCGKILDRFYLPASHKHRFEFYLDMHRLFWICLITFIFGLSCFIINVMIKGYIPFFVTDRFDAYLTFYTKFYIVVIASIVSSGLCYYTIKTQNIHFVKKVILYACIAIEVFIIPTLLVSRGNQMIALLGLTVAVVSLNKHKFVSLTLCICVALCFYILGSYARSLSAEYLNYVFRPKQISFSVSDTDEYTQNTESQQQMDIPETAINSDGVSVQSLVVEEAQDHKKTDFVLSPQAAFMYAYLSVSHDNLNEAILYTGPYTHGLRQLAPFTIVLRFRSLIEKIDSAPFREVSPGMNTGNLVTAAYYDFGSIGSIIFILIWSIIFGMIEGCYATHRGPFAMLLNGVLMMPAVLGFHQSWMSHFTFWLLLGTTIILWFCATFHFNRTR